MKAEAGVRAAATAKDSRTASHLWSRERDLNQLPQPGAPWPDFRPPDCEGCLFPLAAPARHLRTGAGEERWAQGLLPAPAGPGAAWLLLSWVVYSQDGP